MAQVFSLCSYRNKFRSIDNGQKSLDRVLAKQLIRNAASILSALGEEERKVGWMLEDCVDLLSEQERRMRSNPVSNPNKYSLQALHGSGVEFAPLVRISKCRPEDASRS